MWQVLGKLWFLYLSVSIFILGRGVMSSYIPLRGDVEGFSISSIGLLQGGNFFGFAIGAYLVPPLIRSIGYIRTFGVCAAFVSISPLLQAIKVNADLWLLAQVIFGMGTAGVYIVVESWINEVTPNEHRGKVFSIYILIGMLLLAAAPLLIPVFEVDMQGGVIFLFASMMTSLAFLPLAMAARQTSSHETNETVRLKELYRRSPYGVVGIFLSLLVMGMVIGIFILYINNVGFDAKTALTAMFLYGVGAGIGTYPLGWLSDRMDRRIPILCATFVSMVAFGGIWVSASIINVSVLFVFSFVMGAFLPPLQSLFASHINDRLKQHEMSSVASWLTLAFAVSGAIGSIVVGWFMQWFGLYMFPIIAMGTLVISMVLCTHAMIVRKAVRTVDRGDFVDVSGVSPTVVGQGVYDTYEDEKTDSKT